MPEPFTCLRCGMTSHSPDDYAAGYCGNCHAWTGQSAPRPAAGETELTPAVLLTHPSWAYEGRTGDEAVFRYDPLHVPVTVRWRLGGDLGAFTADWTRGDAMRLRVRADLIARAVSDLAGTPAGLRELEREDSSLRAVVTDMAASHLLPWADPGHDIIGDVRRASEMIWQYRAQAAASYDDAGPPSLAGASIDIEADLTDTGYAAAEEQILAGARPGRAPRRAPYRMPDAVRRREVLDRAEQLIARLDGEGYGVRAKANAVDEQTVSVPELPVADHDRGGNASRWRPGDPVL